MIELAKRAVACKHWRWMRGITLLDGGLVTGERNGVPIVYARDGRHSADMLPDLTDLATLGCLLALVREAWKLPYQHPCAEFIDSTGTIVWEMGIGNLHWSAKTEAEVLVAALEAAP